MKKVLLTLLVFLMGCSSAQIVSTWKNPEIVVFDAYKVLVVGMTPNEEGREMFETKMVREFKRNGVEAMRSIDLFDVEFTNTPRTDVELDEVEEQLLARDFDAILFTKVLGSENRQSFRQRMADIEGYDDRFRDDYLSHQDIYYDADYYDEFTVYHVETSLYCICVGKERSLIWRCAIDVTDPASIRKTVDDYVELLVVAMMEQDLIFHKEDIVEPVIVP
ncbi:hypothetical protein [Lentiprolixibacter aurantiacus]|uniref:Cardiolipin synthetase n=1 Tax=Lentiprolixibacter aurantiacus TaxID=2993939 RepID=A0AAE3MNF8_9FLAO|nr:hypothetical protein [Lentiprolixibacter aurantiacus]MCX2720099.1 hypothetical protein [Lentiprolixibacter aurantiacus]